MKGYVGYVFTLDVDPEILGNIGKRNALNVCRLKYGIVLCTSCLRIFEDHWQHCNTSAKICIPDSLAPRLELVSSLFILYSGTGI